VAEVHTIPAASFDRLLHRLSEPGRYCPRVAKVLSTPSPWDAECDKTSTPADQ
jgi:hypothetical protein